MMPTAPLLLVLAALARGAGANPACSPPGLPMGRAKGGDAQIKAPAALDGASVAAWLGEMRAMRAACQSAIGFNGSAFAEPALAWTRTAFIGPQMHVYDRFFFDPTRGNGTGGAGYTVDRWLADLNARYGGIDRAVLWPTYTNLGVDERNQFDLTRSLPGGAAGLKAVVAQLRARGVRTLWAYNPWDRSTAGSEHAGATDPAALATLIRDTGADGFNGDCMGHIPRAFQDAARAIAGRPIAMEAEGGLGHFLAGGEADLNYDTLGWAEGFLDREVGAPEDAPDVDKAKWVSGGKAMSSWSDRYAGSLVALDQFDAAASKIPALQTQFFNALGFQSWENVWGVWNGITPRDGEALRRCGTMLRFFGGRGFLTSRDWVPHTAEALQMERGVFASAFPSPSGAETVYLLVNRRPTPLAAPQLRPAAAAAAAAVAAKYYYYDCYNGAELALAADGSLSFEIEGSGFGCVLATPNATAAAAASATAASAAARAAAGERLRSGAPAPPPTLPVLLAHMSALTARPLSSFSPAWHFLPQAMVNGSTPRRPLGNASTGEVYVHGGPFHFNASSVQIEGGAGSGTGAQFPWEPHPQRRHSRDMQLSALYVDKHPVTNAQYAEFLAASGYAPADTARWLEQNFEPPGAGGAGQQPRRPRAGWEQRPVTFVSLADARAYCAHHGKRLPQAYEWQYFAMGPGAFRLYPWGDADDPTRTPAVSNNFTNPGPEPVGLHPRGASPFGVQDLVRSVWQMTSEFSDSHTRLLLLRGGANYNPWRGGPTNASHPAPGAFDPATGQNLTHPQGGSRWYFRPAYRLDAFNQYLLMSGSYERSSTIGFRCVADAEDDCGTDGRLCLEQRRPGERAAPRGRSVMGAVRPAVAGGAGVELELPGGSGGAVRTLTLTLRSRRGAVGELTAAVAGGAHVRTLLVRAAASVLAVTWRGGGPLVLRYASAAGSVCDAVSARAGRPCVQSAEDTNGPGQPMYECAVTLSAPPSAADGATALLDWAHWGATNATGLPSDWAGKWFAVEMSGGPGLLRPALLPPPSPSWRADLTTWPGQFWPSDRAVFHWQGGAPQGVGVGVRAGVTSAEGTFSLTLPAANATGAAANANAGNGTSRRLTLFVGLFNFGSFGNWATLTAASPGQPPVTRTFDHDNGSNNNWRNLKIGIVFDGELTVTWRCHANPANNKKGLASLQAARLEAFDGGRGAATLQAAVLSEL